MHTRLVIILMQMDNRMIRKLEVKEKRKDRGLVKVCLVLLR